MLSFGATKNGALAAEAVVFFDARAGREFEFRRKRGGHLFSKMRLLSVAARRLLRRRPVARQRPPRQRHGAPAGGRADAAQGHAAALSGRRQRDLRGAAGAHARRAAGRGRAVPSLAVRPAGRARLPAGHRLRHRSRRHRPLPVHRQGQREPHDPSAHPHRRPLGRLRGRVRRQRPGHAAASFLARIPIPRRSACTCCPTRWRACACAGRPSARAGWSRAPARNRASAARSRSSSCRGTRRSISSPRS